MPDPCPYQFGYRARFALSAALLSCLGATVATSPPASAEDGKTTVAVVGDSLGVGLQNGLYHAVPKSVRFIRAARHNTGLTRAQDYDWPGKTAAVVKKYKVDTLIVFVGANDFQRMVIRKGGVKILHRGSDAWKEIYRARVKALAEGARTAGARRVIWVGLPIVRSSVQDRRYRILNAIYRDVASSNDGVTFFPTRALTARKTEAGELVYTPYKMIGKRRRLLRNTKDGIHFTVFGYRYLAQHLWKAIAPAG